MLGNWLRSPQNKSNLRVSDIEVNTVDAFQGREKDIIMINCVRSNLSASLKGSLGFLIDERRMNVAITRAKHFLFIVGNSVTLSKNPTWAGLIKECSSNRDGLIKFTSHHQYSQAALEAQFSFTDSGSKKRLDREYDYDEYPKTSKFDHSNKRVCH